MPLLQGTVNRIRSTNPEPMRLACECVWMRICIKVASIMAIGCAFYWVYIFPASIQHSMTGMMLKSEVLSKWVGVGGRKVQEEGQRNETVG